MSDDDDSLELSAAELTDAEFLRDLAKRLMHVPGTYGVDQGDVDRLIEIAGAAT